MASVTYQEIKNTLRNLYLDDPRPWLVGFSGGKDSTMLASLIVEVVAGIPDDEATVKTFSRRDGRIVLTPANPAYEPMVLDGDDVTIFGKVVTIVRQV